MEYEVADVEAVENDRGLLVEVHYWHDDPTAPEPDHVEHHYFQQVPVIPPEYELTKHGWAVTTDGEPVPNWHQVNGQWVKGPDPIHAPRLVVKRTSDELALEWVQEHLHIRASVVKKQRLQGEDLFSPKDRPKKTRRVNALGNKLVFKQKAKGQRRRHD